MATKEQSEIGQEQEHSDFANEARLEYEDEALEEEEKEFEDLANTLDKDTPEKDEEHPEKDSSETEGGDDWEKRYKDATGEFTKSQQANKDLETKLGDLDSRLQRLGGLDNLEKYITMLQTDPDFVKVLNQKKDKQSLGIDEEGLTPDAKEVLSLIKKIAKAEISEELARAKTEFDGKVDPYIEAAKDRVLGEIYSRMDDNYGESWSDELETIQELSKDWSEERLAKLQFSDVEELYIVALKRNGKLDKFAEDIYSKKIAKTKEKSTPLSRSGAVTTPPKGKVKNMFDAAKRAELKAKRAR